MTYWRSGTTVFVLQVALLAFANQGLAVELGGELLQGGPEIATPAYGGFAGPVAEEDYPMIAQAAVPPAGSDGTGGYGYPPGQADSQAGDPNQPGTDGSGVFDIGKGKVALNFDNADLREVVTAIAGMVGIKYVVEPGIEGTVTIRTAGAIAKKELLSALDLVLEINGLTAIKDGDFYRITSIQGASRLPIAMRLQDEGAPRVRRKEIVTQILPLKYIAAAEMSKLIEPFLSPTASIISHEGSNTLLVVDTGANVAKAVKLVEAFDIGILEETSYRFFFLKNADPEATVNVFKEVFATEVDGSEGNLKFIAIDRLDALLALSSDKRAFERIEQLLAEIDKPSAQEATTGGTKPALHVYFVKNGTALNLADLLQEVFAEALAAGEGSKPPASPRSGAPRNAGMGRTNPLQKAGGKEVAVAETPPIGQAAARPEGTPEDQVRSGILGGAIKITPDEIRNALIIEAAQADYRVILDVLETIDVLPRQVLIEATIAEIDYSISSQLGVDWEYLSGAKFTSGLASLTSSGSSGLRIAVGLANPLRATLNALEQENKANIINSPHILASDNQSARIDVSQEIPIVSAETVIPSGGDSIVTTTVQYRDTGVLLTVTPHINDRKLVTMDIYQEISEQADSVSVAGDLFPSFFKRVVETSLTVEHGQTIVLGGLIRENSSKGTAGVPCLARLPGVGFIFGQRRDSLDKTELVILLTPNVITSLDEVDTITEGFKSKVDNVVREMYEKRSVPFTPLFEEVFDGGN